MRNDLDRARAIVTSFDYDPGAFGRSVSPPLLESSLFTFDSYAAFVDAFKRGGVPIYTRGLNPTTRLFEEKVAALEGGEACKAFASGMGAISASTLAFLRSGDELVCVRNVYGDAFKLFTHLLPRFGIGVRFADGTDVEAVEQALTPKTRVLYLESPTSLTFELQDLRAIAAVAKERGIVTIVDNTWATPIFQRPLQMGIDIVLHSASKYLGGHSDVVAGVVVASRDIIDHIARTTYPVFGAVLGPFEAWLLLRGLRTLPLRMTQHFKSALSVATFLEEHPKVRRVHYPLLPSHPQYELALRQLSGGSGLLSIELDTDEAGIQRFSDALRFFRLGVSWGGFESLACPASVLRAAPGEPKAVTEFGVPPTLVRLHVGLEPVDALIDDLSHALAQI